MDCGKLKQSVLPSVVLKFKNIWDRPHVDDTGGEACTSGCKTSKLKGIQRFYVPIRMPFKGNALHLQQDHAKLRTASFTEAWLQSQFQALNWSSWSPVVVLFLMKHDLHIQWTELEVSFRRPPAVSRLRPHEDEMSGCWDETSNRCSCITTRCARIIIPPDVKTGLPCLKALRPGPSYLQFEPFCSGSVFSLQADMRRRQS